MCGIIGAFCNNPHSCHTILFSGLKYLQNRGYDSAGICTLLDGNPVIHKYASTQTESALELLGKKIDDHQNSFIGFGHTRWATHGAKSDCNSHPHISNDSKVILAHNGIIENYKTLKQFLEEKSFSFYSDTDTEVICNIISYNYSNNTEHNTIEDFRYAIELSQTQMTGSWGLVIQCTDFPDNLFCVRRGSPLLVGRANNEVIIASEQSGFGNRINTYFILKTNDVCIIGKEDDTNEISIETSHQYHLSFTNKQTFKDNPEPYEHWTIREIYDQVSSSDNAISLGGRVLSRSEVRLGGLDNYKKEICKMDNLILLGCGTSYYSGLIAMNFFKEICNLNCVIIFDGAEFTKNDIPKQGKTMAIFISQSGETKDLHRCINISKENDVFTIGAVNVVDSLIAREVDCGVYLNAGREVAVASTKAFSSQIIILSLISIWIAQNKNIFVSQRIKYIEDLHNLSSDIHTTLEISDTHINDELLSIFTDRPSCFLLGKGAGEGTAKEGSLKLKELTYIHSEGYSSSSLKHGPFALLNEGFPVILFAPQDKHFLKNQNAFQEIISRGASVIVIHNDIQETGEDSEEKNKINNYFDGSKYQLIVPCNHTFQSIINIIPIQILSYKLSVHKGINPDIPKNLAKVVTVE
jgi:glutamine---fructose-6-phosphate transaminase (isomerizing)